jgi:Zn-dependent protease
MISLIQSNPVLLMLILPTILISLTIHEFAHGYVAYRCGDDTAKMMGRLTINPLKHLDIVGTLMMFFVGFGWAKPVPINPRNFRKPRRDLFFVSIAGITANLILALIGSIAFFALAALFLKTSDTAYSSLSLGSYFDLLKLESPIVEYDQTSLFSILNSTQQITLQFLSLFASLNTGLAIFNLIPIPPLDGSKLLSTALPPIMAAKYLRIEYYTRYIFLGMLFLSYAMPAFNNIIWIPVEFLRNIILYLYQWLMLMLF